MRFEEDPAAGMRGECEKHIKRGWFIGSEEFRERLDALLMGRSRNDKEGLLAAKSTRMEKQALAWRIKKNTSVRGKWIAESTRMGHPSTASLAIHRFIRDNRRAATRIRKRLQEELSEK